MSTVADILATTSFETEIGRCAISWTERGIRSVTLAGGKAPGVEPAEAPCPVRAAIAAVTELLAGEAADLSAIALDLEGVEPFDQRVGEVARTIAPGRTLTYGEVAERVGAPGEAREVGRALARNRFPIIVPCHRVIAAGRRLGGFSAQGGIETKLKLLELERAHAGGPMTLFD